MPSRAEMKHLVHRRIHCQESTLSTAREAGRRREANLKTTEDRLQNMVRSTSKLHQWYNRRAQAAGAANENVRRPTRQAQPAETANESAVGIEESASRWSERSVQKTVGNEESASRWSERSVQKTTGSGGVDWTDRLARRFGGTPGPQRPARPRSAPHTRPVSQRSQQPPTQKKTVSLSEEEENEKKDQPEKEEKTVKLAESQEQKRARMRRANTPPASVVSARADESVKVGSWKGGRNREVVSHSVSSPAGFETTQETGVSWKPDEGLSESIRLFREKSKKENFAVERINTKDLTTRIRGDSEDSHPQASDRKTNRLQGKFGPKASERLKSPQKSREPAPKKKFGRAQTVKRVPRSAGTLKEVRARIYARMRFVTLAPPQDREEIDNLLGNDMSHVHAFVEEEILTEKQRITRGIARKKQVAAVFADDVQALFDSFDTDQSGYIDESEFKELLGQLLQVTNFEDIPHNRFEHFWRQCDEDLSGEVCFESFLTWYLKNFPPTEQAHSSPMLLFYSRIGQGWRSSNENYSVNGRYAED